MLTVALLMLVSLWLLQMLQSFLIFDHRLIAAGQVWRIWTGHFVHTNSEHLLLNAVGFSLFLLLYQPHIRLLSLLYRSVYLATGIGFGLFWLNPEIGRYAGLSGVLYGLFSLFALQAIFKQDYLVGYAVFFAVSSKILWENIDPSINHHNALLINARVASEAHLYGYLAALVYVLFYKFKYIRCLH
jgi:rhomboid family GlyGly-CTERM serine protease